MSETTDLCWWGETEVPRGAWWRWRIGSLSLWAKRLECEWRLSWQEEAGEAPEVPEVAVPSDAPPESANRERVASHRLGDRLAITPLLADRPMVVRPETRFRLAPGGEAEIYVGTTLWVGLSTAEPAHRLLEVPIQRPSDTWFGPSTTEGELCYAGRTAARLRRENLPDTPPFWAVTHVHLKNAAAEDLVLERINLPVPHLALFAEGCRLWTQTVSVDSGAGGNLAEVHIEEHAPAELEGARRIVEPRVAVHKNVFSRALGALLG